MHIYVYIYDHPSRVPLSSIHSRTPSVSSPRLIHASKYTMCVFPPLMLPSTYPMRIFSPSHPSIHPSTPSVPSPPLIHPSMHTMRLFSPSHVSMYVRVSFFFLSSHPRGRCYPCLVPLSCIHPWTPCVSSPRVIHPCIHTMRLLCPCHPSIHAHHACLLPLSSMHASTPSVSSPPLIHASMHTMRLFSPSHPSIHPYTPHPGVSR